MEQARMAGQFRFQKVQCFTDMFTDCGFGDLQLFCDFLVREAFLPAQLEYLPAPRRQLVDGLLKQFSRLLEIELACG